MLLPHFRIGAALLQELYYIRFESLLRGTRPPEEDRYILFGMRIRLVLLTLVISSLLSAHKPGWSGLAEVNPPADPATTRPIALVGATLIDGSGGPVITDSTVIVRGGRISEVGKRGDVAIPSSAQRIDVADNFLLPGMFDAHFHSHDKQRLDRLLNAGFTSLRDPGRPLPIYLEGFLHPRRRLPRTFLTGPHFDQKPHAHPHNAVHLGTAEEVRELIDQLIDGGASAIKIYYRLPLDLIPAACEQADRHGVPVTAHLELIRADAAIRAGLDGIEHTTSVGTTIAAEADAHEFERAVAADNKARDEGRYRLWSRIRLENNPKVDAFLALMVERGTYLVPTLRPFEPTGDKVTEESLAGFEKMQRFTRMAFEAGVPVLSSSHGPTPEGNWREFELLVDAGFTPKEALETAMLPAARFFGAAERLGSIDAGKAADLVLLSADPTADIKNVRKVARVMLNGVWVE